MSKVIIKQMPSFKRAYKKHQKKQKTLTNQAILEIIKNPRIGQEKNGDLSDIFVYKMKMDQQELLLAYEWDEHQRLLLALGVHENFYRDLKKKIN